MGHYLIWGMAGHNSSGLQTSLYFCVDSQHKVNEVSDVNLV